MQGEIEYFIEALSAYVRQRLAENADADYVNEAVEIADARNGLFRTIAGCTTDEEHDIFALRSLCRLDPETFLHEPDKGRIRSLARQYF